MPIAGIYGPDDFAPPIDGRPSLPARRRPTHADDRDALPMPQLSLPVDLESRPVTISLRHLASVFQIGSMARQYTLSVPWCPGRVIRDVTPGRGIPAGCVAHRSLMPNKLALRALRSGRRARNICHRISDSGHSVAL